MDGPRGPDAAGRPMGSILLVADDAHRTALATAALEGWRSAGALLVARDGAGAIGRLLARGARAALGAAGPSVVLLDSAPPGIDAPEVLRRIRGDPRLRHTPVVVL